MGTEVFEKIPLLRNNIILQEIDANHGDKETVVVLPSKNQIKVVNEVGSFILHLIDSKRTVGEIVEEVQRQYAAPAEQIEKDVVTFLGQLAEKEIIDFIPGYTERK